MREMQVRNFQWSNCIIVRVKTQIMELYEAPCNVTKINHSVNLKF